MGGIPAVALITQESVMRLDMVVVGELVVGVCLNGVSGGETRGDEAGGERDRSDWRRAPVGVGRRLAALAYEASWPTAGSRRRVTDARVDGNPSVQSQAHGNGGVITEAASPRPVQIRAPLHELMELGAHVEVVVEVAVAGAAEPAVLLS